MLANDAAKLQESKILFLAPEQLTVAHWEDIAFVHWLARADSTAMERVHSELRPIVSEYPDGVSFIHVTHQGVGLPDAGARAALARMMAEFAEVTVCVGVVLLGNGFWASAMQSLLTGMRLIAPPRHWQMRFATHEAEIADWVARLHTQRTQRAIEADHVAGLIQEILARR